MASELEEIGRRLRDGGYHEGSTLITTLAHSLRSLRLVPPRLPIPAESGDGSVTFRNRTVRLDVNRLRHVREHAHFSQRGLARAARLSPSYVSNVESHAPYFTVRWATVVALAGVLDVNPNDLIDTTDALK